jgi:hypothetical protein
VKNESKNNQYGESERSKIMAKSEIIEKAKSWRSARNESVMKTCELAGAAGSVVAQRWRGGVSAASMQSAGESCGINGENNESVILFSHQ